MLSAPLLSDPCYLGVAMFRIRAASVTDFASVAEIITSSYAVYDPAGAMTGRHPVALEGAPFSWWGEPTLSWWLAFHDERPAGFAMWRHQGRDVHLHSFFVASDAQRRGVGSALMTFHFEQSAKENPTSDSLTLHVMRDATWARAFYAHHGYVERDPKEVPLHDESGLGDWVRTYTKFGWPADGKILMHRGRDAST